MFYWNRFLHPLIIFLLFRKLYKRNKIIANGNRSNLKWKISYASVFVNWIYIARCFLTVGTMKSGENLKSLQRMHIHTNKMSCRFQFDYQNINTRWIKTLERVRTMNCTLQRNSAHSRNEYKIESKKY